MDAKTLYNLGTALVLAGIIIIAVATALILRRKKWESSRSQGRRSHHNRTHRHSLRHGQRIPQDTHAALDNSHGAADSAGDSIALLVKLTREDLTMATRETAENADQELNTQRKLLTLLVLGFAVMMLGITLT